MPWGASERAEWLAVQTVQRSYAELVEAPVKALGASEVFLLEAYAELGHADGKYSVYALSTHAWKRDAPTVLVTGGVHGYETSGVLGALRFAQNIARDSSWRPYAEAFNFLVLPCISPWAFETINRWNSQAVDPNRSFLPDGKADEASAVMRYLEARAQPLLAHFDLHETTDTDNTEFRPALGARDAKPQDRWDIPDGFYTVADSSRPAPEFQEAVVEAVRGVTHIAPADNGKLIGEPIQQAGVIAYDGMGLGLCMGVTHAPYVTTTEVYPDSERVTQADCVNAQLAAIRGGLDFLLRAGAA